MKIKTKDSGIYGTGADILFVDGKYYVLSSNPAKVSVSEDLTNWTDYPLDTSYLKPAEMTYGNGVFLISGQSVPGQDTHYYYSSDGVNWVPKTLNTGLTNHPLGLLLINYVNNRFILGGTYSFYYLRDPSTMYSRFYIFESVNGLNWTRHTYEFSYPKKTATTSAIFNMNQIVYHKGKYVLVGSRGGIYTSTNLDNWKRITISNMDKALTDIVYQRGKYVVVGYDGTILTSLDGDKWEKQDSTTTQTLRRLGFGNGMFIAGGYNGAILQSYDGISWVNISDRNGTKWSMVYNNLTDTMVILGSWFTNTHTIPLFLLSFTRDITTSDDSSLFFFDKELNLLGVVDYFISLRWRRKYFEAGEFEIVLPVNDYVRQFLNEDTLVLRNNYTEAGFIETIEYSDDGTNEEVTISGRFLSAFLDRRIVKSKINFSGTTIDGMNTIIDAMTPLTNQWETETVTMSSPHIDFQVTYKNVYEYLCKLAEYSNIGFRVVPNVDSKVYMFEVWKGLDRTSSQSTNEEYSFSDDNFNIEQGKLIMSEKTKANYVLVGGTGEDPNRILVTVDEGKTGFDLYEIFSDQKSLSNNNLTTSEYKAKLQSVGEGKLSDGTFQLEVTALAQNDYKTKWNLGDIVNIKKEKWGVYTTYRIIEVEETIEDGKKTIYPKFGSPLSSAWDDE